MSGHGDHSAGGESDGTGRAGATDSGHGSVWLGVGGGHCVAAMRGDAVAFAVLSDGIKQGELTL